MGTCKLIDPSNLFMVVTLFVSTTCIFSSMIVYHYTGNSGLNVWTQRPFVNYNVISDTYSSVTTVASLFAMRSKLLDAAWCTDVSENYQTCPFNLSQSCDCLYQQYATLWDQIYPAILNNAGRSAVFGDYIHSPWKYELNYSQVGKYAVDNFNDLITNTGAVSKTLLDTYVQTSVTSCRYTHSTWRKSLYPTKLHPCIIGYVCAFALFMFSSMYMELVIVPAEYGSFYRYFGLFFVTLAAVLPLILDQNIVFNLIYIITLILISVTFSVVLRDEFVSITQTEFRVVLTSPPFVPPHPIRVGMWYVIYVTFPLFLTYTALMNFTRDVIALLGVWVIGVVIATLMQRYFWCKCYLHQNMWIESYGKQMYQVSEKTGSGFHLFMTWCIGVILAILFSLTGCFLYVDWYSQRFMTGNWFGMSSLIIYFLVFVIELFQDDSKPRDFNNGLRLNALCFTQLTFLNVAVLMLCITSWTDSFLSITINSA